MILNNANNIMLGDSNVDKVYCGDVLVWPQNTPTPIYNDIIEHFNLDGTYIYHGYIDSSWITFHNDIKLGRIYFVTNEALNFHDYSVQTSSGINNAQFSLSKLYTYNNYLRINDVEHKDGDDNFYFDNFGNSDVPFRSPLVKNENDYSEITSIVANYANIGAAGVPSEIQQFINYTKSN